MLLLIGGCQEAAEKGVLRNCQGYRPGDCWSTDFPLLNHPRRGATAHFITDPKAQVSTRILVAGGCEKPGSHLNSVECWERKPDSSSWEILSCALLQGRSCHMGWEKGGKFYVFGGFDGLECLDSVEKVDVSSHVSQSLPPLPSPIKNGSLVSAPQEDSVLLLGGWDGQRTLRTVFQYDLKRGKSEMVALLPYPIECAAAVESPDFAYLFGGYDGTGVRNTIIRYDKRTKVSDILEAQLLRPKECHSALKIENSIFVVGGWSGTEPLADAEMFNITSDSCLSRSIHCQPLPIPASRPCVVQM